MRHHYLSPIAIIGNTGARPIGLQSKEAFNGIVNGVGIIHANIQVEPKVQVNSLKNKDIALKLQYAQCEEPLNEGQHQAIQSQLEHLVPSKL